MRRLPIRPHADPLALDDETVERLLTGELSPAQAPPGYAGVAALLAATVAPPSPEELSGQAAALAELRAATRPRRVAGTWRATRPPRRRRAGLAAVVLVGAVATGGAAAAASGHLPGPVREAARSILGPLGGGAPAPPSRPGSPPGPVATGGPASAGATTGPQGSQPTGTAVRRPASTAAAGAAAAVDSEGLCRAYLAGEGDEQGKKLEATVFQALAKAAGGAEKIDDYCAALLPGEAKPKDKDQPPPGDQGQGQEQEQGNGQGQGGPPPSTGAGNQGQPAPGGRSPGR
jgi:hypothetical protein